MTVELRYCEVCAVICPVDRDRPEPERTICENCRTLSGPAGVPQPGTAAAPVRGGPQENSALAATQPVSRPPPSREEQRAPEPLILRTSRPARRRSRLPALMMGTAVLAPLLLGTAFLTCTIRDRGFAVRGSTGERLEWLGERVARGALHIQRSVLGIPPGAVDESGGSHRERPSEPVPTGAGDRPAPAGADDLPGVDATPPGPSDDGDTGSSPLPR